MAGVAGECHRGQALVHSAVGAPTNAITTERPTLSGAGPNSRHPARMSSATRRLCVFAGAPKAPKQPLATPSWLLNARAVAATRLLLPGGCSILALTLITAARLIRSPPG